MLVIDTRGEAVEVQGPDKRRLGRERVKRDTVRLYRAVLALDRDGMDVADIAAVVNRSVPRVYAILADLQRIRRNRGLAELAA